MKTTRKLLVILLLLCIVLSNLAAATDDLLVSDVPVSYGDASFRARILDRTKGERSPIGLVLSGGSARAFAHIGVLKYLEEQGIAPDFIISNSMGSIVGLLYAAGLSPDQILDCITSVSIQSLFDLTLPLEGGMLDSSRFLAKVASIIGTDLQVESLPIPIIVITEDLVTKRQVQISEGDFYTVLQASYALPVYFPPVEYKGHLLIDGGVTNLVPVDLAYKYADSVIVSTTFYDVDTLNLKNPLTILNVTLDIGKRRRGVEELKKYLDDVIWIRCPVENVSFMEFDRANYLSEQGYDAAKEQAEKISLLPKSTLIHSLDAQRANFAVQLKASSAEYQLFKHVPLNVPSFLFGVGIDSDYKQPDISALKDDTTLGMKLIMRKQDLSFTVNPGFAFQSRTNDQLSAAPAVRTQFDYYFLQHLHLSIYNTLLYDINDNSPVANSGITLEGKIFTFDDLLEISLLQSYEQIDNFNGSDFYDYWDGHSFLYTVSARGQLHLTDTDQAWSFDDTALSLSFQMLGDFSTTRSFLSARFSGEAFHNKTDIFVSMYGFGRFALDGNGDVPFFNADGFRTTDTQIKSQGHDLTVSTNTANHLVGMGLTVGYRPKSFNPTVAELLIFQNNSVGLYSDFLWSQNSFTPYLSIGLELHSDISLLGIRTLPLSIYAGWDQKASTVVWGFYFNLIY